MSEKRVVAIVGCGRIAKNAHFPALASLGNVRIKYACDLLPEKAEALKAEIRAVGGDAMIVPASRGTKGVFVLPKKAG